MGSRNYMITCYEYDNLLAKIVNPPDNFTQYVQYLVGQLEQCPTTQRTHYQGYIELKKTMRVAGLKKLLNDNTIHIENRRGTQQQAIEYVTKTNTRIQEVASYGTPAVQGKRTDIDLALEEIRMGIPLVEIIEEKPHLVRIIKSLERYKTLHINSKVVDVSNRTVTVITGPSGAGKTTYVREKEPDLWVVPISNGTMWFDGYEGQEAVLFDDYNGEIPYRNFLRLLHNFVESVPIKGGHINWTPIRIYITSNKEWYRWYQGDNPELERRITENVTMSRGNTNTLDIPKKIEEAEIPIYTKSQMYEKIEEVVKTIRPRSAKAIMHHLTNNSNIFTTQTQESESESEEEEPQPKVSTTWVTEREIVSGGIFNRTRRHLREVITRKT